MGKKKAEKKNNDGRNQTKKSCDNAKTKQIARHALKISAYVFSIIFALLLLVFIFRDFLIKTTITGIGSWATGVEISVNKFDTSAFSGQLTIEGLHIANPKGFAVPALLELGRFHVDIDMSTLFSDKIVIEKIEVLDVVFTSEFDSSGKFNLSVIDQNLQKRFGAPQKKAEGDDEEDDKEEMDGDPPALLIKQLAVSSSLIMQHDTIGLPLTIPIKYSNSDMLIENKKNDTTLLEYFSKFAAFMEELCSSSLKAGGLVIDAGKTIIKGTTETTKKVFDSTKNIFNSAAEGLMKLTK